MSDARHGSRRRQRSEDEATEVVDAEATGEEEATDLDDVDALLDEIDSVLEENAEDFVRNYVQKGGQ